MKLCKCGCGEEVASNRDYKNFHYWRVYKSPHIFKKGHKAWWTDQGKENPFVGNLRPHKKGEYHTSKKTKKKISKSLNKGISPLTALRRSADYFEWRKSVYERDDFTCRKCKERGGKLTPHHLYSFREYPSERFKVSNGATLCLGDHQKFHRKFGRSKNTPDQFEQFMGINE